jgi:transposase-like protein
VNRIYTEIRFRIFLFQCDIAPIQPEKEEFEVDESYFGAEAVGKYGRSKDNKVLIVIVVELDGKKLGRVRIELVNDETQASLVGFVKRNVEQNSEVITDAWNGYLGLEKENYKHTVFNQKQAKNEEEMLPHVHLKRWLMGTHQGAVEPKHL